MGCQWAHIPITTRVLMVPHLYLFIWNSSCFQSLSPRVRRRCVSCASASGPWPRVTCVDLCGSLCPQWYKSCPGHWSLELVRPWQFMDCFSSGKKNVSFLCVNLNWAFSRKLFESHQMSFNPYGSLYPVSSVGLCQEGFKCRCHAVSMTPTHFHPAGPFSRAF